MLLGGFLFLYYKLKQKRLFNEIPFCSKGDKMKFRRTVY